MNIYIIGHKSPDLDTVACTVEYAEFLKKTERYKDAVLIPAMTSEANKETIMVFKKFDVELPRVLKAEEIAEDDKIILVDHNEEDQRLDGLKSDQIIEIIDHHKIKINFSTPIRIDVRPLGCASTVIYENFLKEGIKPSKQAAGLIVSSIISDTQGLKSSTTTGWDVKTAEDLAKEHDLNIEKLTFEIFKAKSDVEGLTPVEIVMKDYKVFDFSGKKVFIGTVETVEPECLIERANELSEAIEEVKAKLDVGLAFLMITDILKVNTKMIYTTELEKEILEKAFNGVGENNVINIGPKTSRKKDIAPPIEEAVK